MIVGWTSKWTSELIESKNDDDDESGKRHVLIIIKTKQKKLLNLIISWYSTILTEIITTKSDIYH